VRNKTLQASYRKNFSFFFQSCFRHIEILKAKHFVLFYLFSNFCRTERQRRAAQGTTIDLTTAISMARSLLFCFLIGQPTRKKRHKAKRSIYFYTPKKVGTFPNQVCQSHITGRPETTLQLLDHFWTTSLPANRSSPI